MKLTPGLFLLTKPVKYRLKSEKINFQIEEQPFPSLKNNELIQLNGMTSSGNINIK